MEKRRPQKSMGERRGVQSERLKPHFRNAIWAVVEYLWYPILLLIATPILLGYLGIHAYGLWALAGTISAFGGVANFGMASATQKYVAQYRAVGDGSRAVEVVRFTLIVTFVGGALVAGAIMLLATTLAKNAFSEMGKVDDVRMVLILAAAILVVQQVENIFASILKGFERFDLAASLDIVTKLSLVLAMVGTAIILKDPVHMLFAALAVGVFGIVLKASVASRVIGARLFSVRFKSDPASEVLVFGFWGWIHGIAGALLQVVDRLIVGSMLGSAALAQYSICLQLGQQVHALPAAAMAFLLPTMSRKLHQAENLDRAHATRMSVLAGVVLGTLLAVFMALFGWNILVLWVGMEFAQGANKLLLWIILAYFLLSLSVAPHYLLLANGKSRFVAITNILGGSATALGSFFLIPSVGLIGAAISRLFYGPFVAMNYMAVFSLLNNCNSADRQAPKA